LEAVTGDQFHFSAKVDRSVHPPTRAAIASAIDCDGRKAICLNRNRGKPTLGQDKLNNNFDLHFANERNGTMSNQTILVAGGFIGGHLVADLVGRDFTDIRAVDVKPVDQWYQVFDLAADMGGMGFIENNKGLGTLSVLINTHLLMAAEEAGVERFFYASSAGVYNADKQRDPKVVALREEDAYPAMPEDGYGWEKLFSERMCRHFREDFGLATRVARFHNVYGPHGTWQGGREKAPAAICRKVIHAVETDHAEIDIWGDGQQSRSFMYIDDCIQGVMAIANGDILEPVNLGSSELVTINQLVDIVEQIAGVKLKRRYNLDAPKGVNGRNSDNTRIRQYLGWEPSTRLRDGMAKTYAWIRDEYLADRRSVDENVGVVSQG
jgi:GDP-D-mannose 3',5'-epimerase